MSNASPQERCASTPLAFPPDMLAHLGITEKHLEALDVLGLDLEDAVRRGVIRLPEWIKPEQFPQYLCDLQSIHEMGMTLEEWRAALDESVGEGSADEVIRLLEREEA